jgi:excisionase family DNA binding protein
MAVKTEIGEAFATEHEQKKMHDVYSEIRAAEVRLVRPDGTVKPLPKNLQSFLEELLDELNAGNSVTIQRQDATLTTAQAARMLSVSRQFLVQLLEQDQIPFHMVGTHRRVYERDLLAYRTKRDANRRKILDELVQAEMEEGIYDLVPWNTSPSR